MTCPSYSIPNGLVPKTNAFCPSLNVSRSISIESVSLRLGVAPALTDDDLSGSESKLTTPM